MMKTIVAVLMCWGAVSSSAPKPTRPVFLAYQDSHGQYSFGYSEPSSARSEYRSSDGVTRGTYSYLDKNGLVQTTEYEAGKELGFRVKASNLPQAPLPVRETPEVMAARENHLRLLAEAQRREQQQPLQVADLQRSGVRPTQQQQQRLSAQVMQEQQRLRAQALEHQQRITAEIMRNQELFRAQAVQQVQAVQQAQRADERPAQHRIGATSSATLVAIDGVPLRTASLTKTVVAPPPVAAARPATPLRHESRLNAEAAVAPVNQTDRELPTAGFPKLETYSKLELPAFPTLPLVIPEHVTFTPEVMAAREAHFRAHEAASRLAAETDANPLLLERLLRGQGQPSLNGNLLENRVTTGVQADPKAPVPSSLRLSPLPENQRTNLGAAGEKTGLRLDSSLSVSAKKQMDNLAEKPQIGGIPDQKPTLDRASGLTPANTVTTRVTDIRLPSLNEFEQTKLKAETTSICGTGLKVTDSDEIKQKTDDNFQSTSPTGQTLTESSNGLLILRSPIFRNWVFHFTYL